MDMKEWRFSNFGLDYPSSVSIFSLTLFVHALLVVYGIVNDCDETFNYWEPLHLLVTHEDSFQTWEYAPQYGLRSYFYLLICGWPAMLVRLLTPWITISKVHLFFAVRAFFGIINSLFLAHLYTVLRRNVYLGPYRDTVALLHILFGIGSYGNYQAAVSFLPTSTVYLINTLFLSVWLDGRDGLAVFCVAFNAIVGWPYAVVLGVPYVVDVLLLRRNSFLKFFQHSLVSGFLLLSATIAVDSYFYGIPCCASWNQIAYNVFGHAAGTSSSLYGEEGPLFYIKCYLLAFNVLPLTLIVILCSGMFGFVKFGIARRICLYAICPIIIWNVIFFGLAHKEERFLYPVYPFIILLLAFVYSQCLHVQYGITWTLPVLLLGVVYFVLSVARILAVIVSYGGIVALFSATSSLQQYRTMGSVTFCLGQEWHLFPSHFHLPSGWTAKFIEDGFHGQLPAHFPLIGPNYTLLHSTRSSSNTFNGLNLEETDRYAKVDDCHFVLVQTTEETLAKRWWNSIRQHFVAVAVRPILNNAKSILPTRIAYFPFLFETFNVFDDLVVFRNLMLVPP